jgi:hypothetical protein
MIETNKHVSNTLKSLLALHNERLSLLLESIDRTQKAQVRTHQLVSLHLHFSLVNDIARLYVRSICVWESQIHVQCKTKELHASVCVRIKYQSCGHTLATSTGTPEHETTEFTHSPWSEHSPVPFTFRSTSCRPRVPGFGIQYGFRPAGVGSTTSPGQSTDRHKFRSTK